MKLLITHKTNEICTDDDIAYYYCFTEYKMNFANIKKLKLNSNIKNSNQAYNNILLIPMTHINNIWHLLHHIYITYKYIRNNNINYDIIYPIFFDGFYKRQGNIIECMYNDLIFNGLGFDFNKYKIINKIFKEDKYITFNNINYVDKDINFNSEPQFGEFKSFILDNFNITNTIRNKKRVTFILRNETRNITNIEYVKDKLKTYNINYIYLEDYTVKEQIDIIYNTDILIGVHGAGLSWCVFMKNNSILLEMYPGNSNTDNYIRWCNIANIRYKRLIIDITKGNVTNFRTASVNMNSNQVQAIEEIIKNN